MLHKQLSYSDILDYQCRKRPSIWAQRYTKLRGRPYRFEQLLSDGSLDLRQPHEIPHHETNIGLRGQRQFLQQPLDDQHPWKAMQKSRQCGASENEVREALWFADTFPYTKQVYLFPTFDQVADFSKTRIEEVMKDSPYLKDRMGIDPVTNKKRKGTEVVDNVRLRKLGDSWIFFRSGSQPKAGEGIDVDCVRFDEIDRIPAASLTAFNETLSASSFGWRRDVSTPSLPNVGVNASFSKSDQQHWWMRCPSCSHWFTLIHDFPNCVVELPRDSYGRANHDYHLRYSFIKETDLYAYQCMKCKRLVSDETRIRGMWQPLYKHRDRIRGYQISQLICPWISATQLMQKKEDYKLEQLFENYVIGRPYLGDNILLTREDIMQCIDTGLVNPYDLKLRGVCIGTDWGNQSWGIAGMIHPDNPDKVVILDIWSIEDSESTSGENPHIQKSIEKFRQWNAVRGVYDAGYGKDRNWELMQVFPSRVFSCFYPNLSTANSKQVKDQWNGTDAKVNVDRTLTLKIMTKAFRDQQIVIPDWVTKNPLFDTFITHLTNLVLIRDIEEDDKTKKETITERVGTLSGGDHFAHAMNYLMIALRKEEETKSSMLFF